MIVGFLKIAAMTHALHYFSLAPKARNVTAWGNAPGTRSSTENFLSAEGAT